MPVEDGAERVDADHVEAAGGQQGQGDDLAELVPVEALGCFLSLLRNGVEAGVEERGQNQDRHDAGKQAGALGSGLAAASAGDLGEHGHGVVRRAGEQRDAHGEQHAAEQGLGQEGLELGGRAGTAEVEEDDVGCKAERDQRREQVNVGAQDGVELNGAQPLKTGQAAEHLGHEGRNGDGLPRAQDAVAQGQKPSGDVAQRTAKATIDILDDAARDGDSSRELTENSSDGHEEDCTQEECDHSGNGTAAHDHPVADLQNPTGTDDGTETDGEEVPERKRFLHAAVILDCNFCVLVRHCSPPFLFDALGVTPCAVRFAARFYSMALRYGLGAAAPLAARPKAELQNERHRFWDERRETSFVLDAFILSAFEYLLP